MEKSQVHTRSGQILIWWSQAVIISFIVGSIVELHILWANKLQQPNQCIQCNWEFVTMRETLLVKHPKLLLLMLLLQCCELDGCDFWQVPCNCAGWNCIQLMGVCWLPNVMHNGRNLWLSISIHLQNRCSMGFFTTYRFLPQISKRTLWKHSALTLKSRHFLHSVYP